MKVSHIVTVVGKKNVFCATLVLFCDADADGDNRQFNAEINFDVRVQQPVGEWCTCEKCQDYGDSTDEFLLSRAGTAGGENIC